MSGNTITPAGSGSSGSAGAPTSSEAVSGASCAACAVANQTDAILGRNGIPPEDCEELLLGTRDDRGHLLVHNILFTFFVHRCIRLRCQAGDRLECNDTIQVQPFKEA